MKDISIFLGANTCRGFFSLYDEYIGSLSLRRLYVVKGSAGSGKSTLMKKVAQHFAESGYDAVRVLCSGDPGSLDGLILPEKGVALFDGTSPHVLEPPLVGERGFYLDLSRYYTSPARDLEDRDAAYREHYRKAYRWLEAAGSLQQIPAVSSETRAAVCRRALSLATRTLGRSRGEGSFRRCFTDAFTCLGPISLPDSRRALAPRLIALSGGSAEADLFLQTYLQAALARGHEAVLCPDPTEPRRASHLLLPGLGLGITTGAGDRCIHLEKLGPAPTETEKAERKELEKLRDQLLSSAREELALAKEAHDRLEEAARPFIDFRGITRETEAFIRRLESDG